MKWNVSIHAICHVHIHVHVHGYALLTHVHVKIQWEATKSRQSRVEILVSPLASNQNFSDSVLNKQHAMRGIHNMNTGRVTVHISWNRTLTNIHTQLNRCYMYTAAIILTCTNQMHHKWTIRLNIVLSSYCDSPSSSNISRSFNSCCKKVEFPWAEASSLNCLTVSSLWLYFSVRMRSWAWGGERVS